MPIPAILGALGSAAGAAASGASAAGYAATAADLTKLAGGLNTAAKGAQVATGGLSSLSRGLSGLTSPLSGAIGILGQFRDGITSLGNSVAGFVEKANPAFVKQFQFAADDLTASIGKALIPVMEYATQFTRAFADVLFALAGPVQRLIRAGLEPLTKLLPTLTNAFAPVVSVLGTVIDYVAAFLRPLAGLGAAFTKLALLPLELVGTAFAKALELLVAPLTVAGRLLGDMVDALNRFIDRGIAQVRRLLGVPGIAGGSVGASARQAQVGSVESFQTKALTAAFGMGTASADERVATTADELYKFVKGALVTAITKDAPAEVARALADILSRLVPGASTARAVGRTVDDVASAGTAAGRFIEARAATVRAGIGNVLNVFGVPTP